MRCGRSAPPERGADTTRAVYLFGTLCHVAVWGEGLQAVRRAAEAGVQALERYSRLLNPFDPDSELSRMNRTAATAEVAVPQELFDVLVVAWKMSAATGGRYDLTVWPLLELWRRCAAANRWPSDAARAEAVRRVDYRRVRLSPARGRVAFDDPGVRVDLSSVAKGAAMDAAMRAIRAAGASGALLDAGGALQVWDRWGRTLDVAVAHPETRHDAIAGFSLRNQAVATSGQGEARLWIEGRPVGHLFDVASGAPLSGRCASVSVIASSALTADLCSTVVFILGPCGAAAFFGPEPPVSWVWAMAETDEAHAEGALECCRRL